MDIWSWVYGAINDLFDQGHIDLANYMERIPRDVLDGRHEKIDNYIEEAVALAKEANHSWAELFLRHWYLQSTVLHRTQPKSMLKEAVSLLEFSTREENLDCPQSTCVVQDLASCYGFIDGPGYVKERLSIAADTLDKITANKNCYTCVSVEYAAALLDSKQHDECLAFLDKVDQDFLAVGRPKDTGNLILQRVTAEAAKGNIERARKLLKKAKGDGHGTTFKMIRRVNAAHVEMLGGNLHEAMEMLPDYKDTKCGASILDIWSAVLLNAVGESSDYDTPKNRQQLYDALGDMMQRGVHRQAFNLAAGLFDLENRDESGYAKTCGLLNTMAELKAKLNRDLGATEILQGLRAQQRPLS